MDFVKKIGTKKIAFFAIILLSALVVFLFIYNKMDYANVYYRTYTKEGGWTKWCVNGQICGTKNNISAIQVKIKSNVKGDIVYNIFSNEWSKTAKNNEKLGDKKSDIHKFKLDLNGKLKNKYNLKYRIKTDDGNWSIWGFKYLPLSSTNSKTKDNTLLSIKKVQMKFEKK